MRALVGHQRSRPVLLTAGAALALTAGVGAWLVFQPDAATSSGVVQRIAKVLFRLGVDPWPRAAAVAEFALNVALFVPGAFAAALLWPRVRWWQWVLIGLLASLSIEALQGALLPGRRAEVRDLCSNTLGAGTGAAAAWVVLRHQDRRGTRRPESSAAAG